MKEAVSSVAVARRVNDHPDLLLSCRMLLSAADPNTCPWWKGKGTPGQRSSLAPGDPAARRLSDDRPRRHSWKREVNFRVVSRRHGLVSRCPSVLFASIRPFRRFLVRLCVVVNELHIPSLADDGGEYFFLLFFFFQLDPSFET